MPAITVRAVGRTYRGPMTYDVVVVGGGAAGLGAARAATRAKVRVLLISDGAPGGECTFSGCVPSKTLIESANQGLPYAAATQRVREVVAQVAATEDPETLRRQGIEVLLGGQADISQPGSGRQRSGPGRRSHPRHRLPAGDLADPGPGQHPVPGGSRSATC